MNLGETLKAFMKLEKLSGKALADASGVSTATIVRLTNMPEPDVNLKTIISVAKELKQPLSRIFKIAETWETK
jgi:transcriptional regulator with XRE-family HTH domain